jgi:hypothetical protein
MDTNLLTIEGLKVIEEIETLGVQLQEVARRLVAGAARLQKQFDETMVTLRPALINLKDGLESCRSVPSISSVCWPNGDGSSHPAC